MTTHILSLVAPMVKLPVFTTIGSTQALTFHKPLVLLPFQDGAPSGYGDLSVLTILRGITPKLIHSRFAAATGLSVAQVRKHLVTLPRLSPLVLMAYAPKHGHFVSDIYLPHRHFDDLLADIKRMEKPLLLSCSLRFGAFSSVLPRKGTKRTALPDIGSLLFQLEHRFLCETIPNLYIQLTQLTGWPEEHCKRPPPFEPHKISLWTDSETAVL